MNAKSTFLALALAVALAAPRSAPAAAAARWWNPQWKYRYPLSLGGGLGAAAWARFSIPPGCAANGEDVRVVNASGAEVKSETLFFQPPVYGVVAFDLGSASPEYWLYLGNPQAAAPRESWIAKAGLFLATYELGKGDANSVEQMRELLKNSPRGFGAGFRSNIFDGFNPFGSPDGFLSVYRGWLDIRRAGAYRFATVSDDASFLSIDGKPVCQWPGIHTAQGGVRGQRSGSVALQPGLHRIDYWHRDIEGPSVAEAAWQPPGSSGLAVIGGSEFAPIRAATAGALEIQGQELVADFSARQLDWTDIDGREYMLYAFNDNSTSFGGSVVDRQWTFGDGQVASGMSVRKLFFRKGDFDVSLTVKDNLGRAASMARPFRVHPIDTAEVKDPDFLALSFADMAASAPLGGLSEADAVAAAQLLISARRFSDAALVFEAVLTRPNAKPGAELMAAVLDLFAGPLEAPDRAEEIARRVLSRIPLDDRTAVQTLLRKGRILLDDLDRPGEALADFKAAALRLRGDRNDALSRLALIGQGDALRALGKAAEAREAYASAERIPLPGAPASKPYDLSSFALTVESHLLSRQWEEARKIVDEWENAHPTEKLAGYSSVLRARLDFEERNTRRAIRELEHFLAADPQGLYAQQALLLLGEMRLALGDGRSAAEAFQKALDSFQDENVQKQAREGLAKASRLIAGEPK